MRYRHPVILAAIALVLGAWGPIALGGGTPAAEGGGGGATFVLVDDAACQGAWIIFSDNSELGAENDACTGGVLDMAWSSDVTFPTALSADEPEGTPALQDAVHFDGENDWFDLADNSAFEATTFTLGCWIQHEAANGNEKFFSHNPQEEWELEDVSGANPAEITRDSNYTEATNTDTPDDDWFHITGRFDVASPAMEIFYNGTIDCTGDCDIFGSAPTGSTDPIRIGANSFNGGSDWSGDIMECWYADRALTDTEIETVYLCGADGNANGDLRDALPNAPACVESTHGCCNVAQSQYSLVDDSACQGAWLYFTDGLVTGADDDVCGAKDMTHSGDYAVAGDEPEGTPAAQDAVHFDGVNDWFTLGDDSAFEATTFTAGCWVQHETGNADEVFFAHDPNDEWGLRDASDADTADARVSSSYNENTATNTPADDWFHITSRFNDTANTLEIFFNGTKDCAGACDNTGSAAVGTTEDIRIGAHSNGGDDWSGDIMECWYVDRALSDVEIATVFLCGIDPSVTPADGAARELLTNAPTCIQDVHGCCV